MSPPPPPPPPPDGPDGPRAHHGPPPGGPGGPPEGFPHGGPPPPYGDAFLRIIRERRPELANRLDQLCRKSPGRFQEIVADALLFRLEERLDELDRSEQRSPSTSPDREPDHPPPPVPGPRRGPDAPSPELRERFSQLVEQERNLENRSRELAGRLREKRAQNATSDELKTLRDELERALNDQFDVRTEFRKLDLQRLEQELARLRTMLEKMHGEFETRQQERGAIIDKRMEQLLGTPNSEW